MRSMILSILNNSTPFTMPAGLWEYFLYPLFLAIAIYLFKDIVEGIKKTAFVFVHDVYDKV